MPGWPALYFKALAQPRHDYFGPLEEGLQRIHRRLFAMHQERALGGGAGMPVGELAAVGMGRETANRIDVRLDRDLLAHDLHPWRVVDHAAGERALRGEADDDDPRLLAPEVVHQVMHQAPASRHARPGHDDRAPL